MIEIDAVADPVDVDQDVIQTVGMNCSSYKTNHISIIQHKHPALRKKYRSKKDESLVLVFFIHEFKTVVLYKDAVSVPASLFSQSVIQFHLGHRS